jgi:hypothetical protein
VAASSANAGDAARRLRRRMEVRRSEGADSIVR